MNENNHKVAVIGLDGATFDLLNPWIEQGKLPTFKRLMDTGCWGPLESTIPPLTAPAWTSFMTGKNPGKHGIFEFVDTKEKDLKLVNSKRIGPGKLWNYLSTYGKKCIILNVPLTYPPEPIRDGVMVTGMLTPPNKPFTYPEDLTDKIKLNVGEYRIDVDATDKWNRKDAYLKDIYKTTELRTRCAKYLLHNYPWDFFTMIYTCTDRLQHVFWNNPNAMLEYYIKLDEHIGELIECLGHNVSIIFVSDHGFRGARRKLYFNHWLEKEGYLSSKKVWTRKKSSPIWRTLIEKEQDNQKGFFRTLLDSIHFRRKRVIDWNATRVYYKTLEGCLYINSKERNETGIVNMGREYETLRDEIIAKLKDLKSPFNDKKVFDRVLKKEEVYNGPFLNIAPDILVRCNDDFYFAPEWRVAKEKKLFKDEKRSLGVHSLYGIFLITGPFAKKGANLNGLKIQDIAPTIMYLMGLPIPEDMDGKVLKDTLDEGYLEKHPLRYEKIQAEKQIEAEVYSKEDEEKLKTHLENLGYL